MKQQEAGNKSKEEVLHDCRHLNVGQLVGLATQREKKLKMSRKFLQQNTCALRS